MRDVNLETITDIQVVVQDLATQWILSVQKQNLHTRRKNLLKFLEPSHRPKVVFTKTTRWNLDEHVKFDPGITALQHLIDPRQTASLKEPFDE